MFFSSAENDRLKSLLSGYWQIESVSDNAHISRNFSNQYSELLFYAGFTASDYKKLHLRLAVYLILVLFLTKLSLWLSVLILSLLIFLEHKILNSQVSKRAKLFERDYPAFLLSLSASVRTGLDPIVAFSNCSKLFTDESLLKMELEKFKSELEQGLNEDRCLANFAGSIKHPDIGLLRSAMILARKEGSSLGSCLQRLARITRQRQSFRRKVKTALSMQKLSAIGISVCALVIVLIQALANIETFKQTLVNPTGQKLLLVGVNLMLIGLVFLLNMAKERV